MQHSFLIKSSTKDETRICSHPNKGHLWKKPTSCMELNDKKLNHCCLRSGEKKKMSGHITSIQHCTGASSQCNKTWKINKRLESIQIGKNK